MLGLGALRSWSSRRRVVAAGASFAAALILGLPTDVIPNPVFGRPVPVTWWSYPTLAISAILSGLLFATYVREPRPAGAGTGIADPEPLNRPGRTGGIGGLVSFFAIGCPVCNKVVVLALGTTGALKVFEPLQPYLAVASVLLLAVAVRARLRGELACPVPTAGA